MKNLEIIEAIEKAKHVVVISHVNPDADSLSSASAVYTYMLKLHKKVSFFCASKNIDEKLKLFPWTEKVRDIFPKDAAIQEALGVVARSLSKVRTFSQEARGLWASLQWAVLLCAT